MSWKNNYKLGWGFFVSTMWSTINRKGGCFAYYLTGQFAMILRLGKFLFDFIDIFLYNNFTNIRKNKLFVEKSTNCCCANKGAMLC